MTSYLQTSSSKSKDDLRRLTNDELAQTLLAQSTNSGPVRDIIHERMAKVGVGVIGDWLRLPPTSNGNNDETASTKPTDQAPMQEMADSNLVEFIQNYSLRGCVDYYWIDERRKQKWEIKDFLEQLLRNTEIYYMDLSPGQQGLIRVIVSKYNEWIMRARR